MYASLLSACSWKMNYKYSDDHTMLVFFTSWPNDTWCSTHVYSIATSVQWHRYSTRCEIHYRMEILPSVRLMCFRIEYVYSWTLGRKIDLIAYRWMFHRPGSVSPITLNDVKNAEKLLLQESRRQVSFRKIFMFLSGPRGPWATTYFRGLFVQKWRELQSYG
jgi:hypothetical protein